MASVFNFEKNLKAYFILKQYIENSAFPYILRLESNHYGHLALNKF